MKSYHFDIGDSSEGPIGLCARVTAESETSALAMLKERLPGEIDIQIQRRPGGPRETIEYICVYLNRARITVDDIDDEEEES